MTNIRLVILLVTAAVSALFVYARGAGNAITRQDAYRMIDNEGRDPVCGIWQLGGDGAQIAIVNRTGEKSKFDIYLIDSPDMSVIPGAVIGLLSATGKLGTYDAQFYSVKGPLKRTMRYIVSLGNDGRMQFDSYKKGKSVALWRWIPYLYRISVTDRNTRPSNADGAVRVYPAANVQNVIVL